MVMTGTLIIRAVRAFGDYEVIVWPDPTKPEHHHEAGSFVDVVLRSRRWCDKFKYRPAWFDDTYTCRNEACRRF